MNKLVTKQPIVNIVLGVIFISFIVFAQFFSDWMDDAIKYVVAGVIIIYTIVRLIKDLKYYKNQTAQLIVVVEAIVITMLAVLLMITEALTVAWVLGLALYMKGVAYLLICQVRKQLTPTGRFFVILILITAGTYVMFSQNAYEAILAWVLFGLFIIYGVILITSGITQIVNERKKRPKKPIAETSEPLQQTETPKLEPKPKETTDNKTLTKSALKAKSVEDLKKMCKARGIQGYSSLNKEALIEKLWLHEKEA